MSLKPRAPEDEPGPLLVVDDDPKTVALVRTYLERESFTVTSAANGRAALASARERALRLAVLDVMLPEIDGLTVARLIRRESDVPILMLSARGSVADRVSGMSEGADDYLPKPFSPAELVVRIKAILRRAEQPARQPPQGTLRHADLVIDLDRYEVRRGGEPVTLGPAEFRILTALVRAEGRVLTRAALLDALYGRGEGEALDRTIDVYIGRLREKLADDAERPRYVSTVRGAGYRMAPERPA
ncbi:response regulator transcription factor [soil metagenome]